MRRRPLPKADKPTEDPVQSATPRSDDTPTIVMPDVKLSPFEEAAARVEAWPPLSVDDVDLDVLTNAGYDDTIELPDPVELIKRAIEADLDPAIFEEDEFPRAGNVIEWCTSPDFLGGDMKPFPKQFEHLVHFFRDCCYQCSDIDYIHNVPRAATYDELLDRFVLLNCGVCPKCKRNRHDILSEWFSDSRFRDYTDLKDSIIPRPAPHNEFVGVWGQRCGKSLMSGCFAFTYVLHRYLQLPSVNRYFDEPSSKVFDAAFVSPKLDQIRRNLWEPLRHAYQASPWFEQYRNYLKEREKRFGVPLYREQQTFVAFVGKRLSMHMSASNASTLRGGTRFWTCIDELAWFNVREDGKKATGARSGEQVYDALHRSLSTLQLASDWRRTQLKDYDALDAYMFNVSSPSSMYDPIMALSERSPSKVRMYYTWAPTWEIHPKFTEAALRELYEDENFERDYGAVPPKAAKPFFHDPDFTTLKSLVHEKPVNSFDLFNYSIEVADDPLSTRQVLQLLLKDIHPDLKTPRMLMVDNGETNNSFALTISRYMPERDGLLLEAAIEISPWRGHSIDLAWCYDEVVLTLCKNFNFLYVGYDRWESTYAINDLRMNHQIDAQRYSLKWADFEKFRDDLQAARIWFNEPEIDPDEVLKIRDLGLRARYPMAHLLAQICTVNQFGNKVHKPDGGNDDLFRTLVLHHYFLRKNIKDIKKRSKYMLRQGAQQRVVGQYVSRGQMGGGRIRKVFGKGAQGAGGDGNGRVHIAVGGSPSAGGGSPQQPDRMRVIRGRRRNRRY